MANSIQIRLEVSAFLTSIQSLEYILVRSVFNNVHVNVIQLTLKIGGPISSLAHKVPDNYTTYISINKSDTLLVNFSARLDL